MRERLRLAVTYTNYYRDTLGRDTHSVNIQIKSKFIEVSFILIYRTEN